MIKLGSIVTDSVTGFTGKVTARAEYLHGEPRIQVSAMSVNKDGEILKYWFDESQLSIKEN